MEEGSGSKATDVLIDGLIDNKDSDKDDSKEERNEGLKNDSNKDDDDDDLVVVEDEGKKNRLLESIKDDSGNNDEEGNGLLDLIVGNSNDHNANEDPFGGNNDGNGDEGSGDKVEEGNGLLDLMASNNNDDNADKVEEGNGLLDLMVSNNNDDKVEEGNDLVDLIAISKNNDDIGDKVKEKNDVSNSNNDDGAENDNDKGKNDGLNSSTNNDNDGVNDEGKNDDPNNSSDDGDDDDDDEKEKNDESEENEAKSTLLTTARENEEITTAPSATKEAKSVLLNFILLSILFSANHGAVVSCLSAATARLGGDLGSWQSSALYLSYTITSLIGATFVVKKFGARNSMMAGMLIYCLYVGCFVIATTTVSTSVAPSSSDNDENIFGYEEYTITTGGKAAVFIGAILGGIGGGVIWTAQGSYFVRASEEYAAAKQQEQQHEGDELDFTLTDASNILGGIFAAIYLLEEVILRLLSSFVIEVGNWGWHSIYIAYTIVAVSSAAGMLTVTNYPFTAEEIRKNEITSPFQKATATIRLLINDPKMKYMVPLNAMFGLTAAFVTSFVSGEVLRIALNDVKSIHVGFLTAITSAVAALCSLIFGLLGKKIGVSNGSILLIGCTASFLVAFVFLVRPKLEKWTTGLLVVVYCLQGIGRATFESTLKSEFAILFSNEKEGAFGNISFQFGIVSMIGFLLTTGVHCSSPTSPYCVEYENGTRHNMLAFEIIIMIMAALGALGHWRGRALYKQEMGRSGTGFERLGGDAEMV